MQRECVGRERSTNAHTHERTTRRYVILAQMLCGIAKDLTKLGGKTVTKLVTPEEQQSSLFKLVSYITGSCMTYSLQVCVLFGYVSYIRMC